MCKSAAQGPAMPAAARTWTRTKTPLQFDWGNGHRSHQSIMPCSWLRHSGRYSFIHSLHSAALFLMVFVVIEAIIRNMHSIFMFVIFPCILRLSASSLCLLPAAGFCFYCCAPTLTPSRPLGSIINGQNV